MTAIVYPSTLPGPSAAGIQAAERRLLSAEPFEARNGQRDRLATQQVTLPPFTAAEAATFRAWFDDTLIFGGAWFAATWPLPAGFMSGVRRWIGQPSWKVVNGFWQVSGPCEVRGRGMPPVLPQVPAIWDAGTSDGGISPYALAQQMWSIDPADRRHATLAAFENFYPEVPLHGVHITVYANSFKSSGKRYFELRVLDTSSSDGDHEPAKVGVCTAGLADYWHDFYSGPSPFTDGGDAATNRTQLINAFRPDLSGAPAILMCAVDLDAGKIWFGKNGAWNGAGAPTADPVTADSPMFSDVAGPVTIFARYYAVMMTTDLVLRTVDADFGYAPPTGFTAWSD
jgi:hypothetical protein